MRARPLSFTATLSLLGAALLLSACASKPVIDYATDTDFSQYRDYQWQASSLNPATDNSLILQRIKKAVDSQLPQAGLKPAGSSQPDLMVNISNSRVATAQKEAPRGGVDLGGGSGGVGLGIGLSIPLGQAKEQFQYSIVVDFNDASSGQLKWRGTQTFTSDESGEALDREINDAVAAILDEYPPAP